jgi:diguanylate cyclase (GGDEF)-like protein
LLLAWVNLAGAQHNEINIKQQIEQCNTLEDDKPNEAINLADQLLKSLNKFEQPIEFGELLGCKGWAFAVSEQIVEARKIARELAELANSLIPSAKSVQVLRKAGSVYHRIGDRVSAAEIYNSALSKADTLNFTVEKIPLLVNLGVLNSELRDHDTAITNYYAALDIMEATQEFQYHAPVLFNLAVTLNGQRRFDEAIEIYEGAEKLINEEWPKQRVSQVYYGLGVGYSGINQLKVGLDYLNKAVENISAENQNSIYAYSVKVAQALVKVKLGEVGEAKAVANEAERFYLSPNNHENLITADNPLTALASLYELLNEPQKALELYKASREIDQQFQNSFNKNYMAQIQAKLSDSKQREELAALKSQNSLKQVELNKTSQQRSLMVLALIFLLIVLLLFWLWQKLTSNKLLKLTMIDTLTQINNRRGVVEWYRQTKTSHPRHDTFLWLLDLDNFRKINDQYGHEVGDTALHLVAQTLQSFSNNKRCVGRWSGEEFILLTQDINRANVAVLSNQILTGIRALTITHGLTQFKVTVSIGVSLVKDESTHMWNRALSQADKALYVAKDRGMDCMVMATDF